MKPDEALALATRAAPAFAAAELCEAPINGPNLVVTSATSRSVASLWAGMGSVEEIRAQTAEHGTITFVAKVIRLPQRCTSVGDQRKADSYDVEAAFYNGGHAAKLISAGCRVPRPLIVERGTPLVICMTKVPGRADLSMDERQTGAALQWLARLHAAYWGHARADAAVAAGLQPQGSYWYLDTRADEHSRMPKSGWEGRLRLAARAIDERLKADPFQTVVHGDAKEANMLFEGGTVGMVDFQYCGKACFAKDLAYCLCCASGVPEAEERLLQLYLADLTVQLAALGGQPPALPQLQDALALAYCDLGRWMSGWGWWGHDLRERIIRVLDRLDGGKALPNEEAYSSAVRREFPIP